jgi:catechol 2,3-dioxygenase-like lactoylglutathione lyase family enzyme
MQETHEHSSVTGVRIPDLTGLHHIGLSVTDLGRSVRWYTEMLGLVQWGQQEYPGGRTALLTRPGTNVYIGLDSHERNAGEEFAPHRTGLDHLALAVADRAELDAWRDHLAARGVECGDVKDLTEPVPCAVLSFADPDGIALEIFHT